MRSSFDPERYRIILFDQRNCGRSTPHASDPTVDMSLNTTEHLLGDMEQLRQHLGVERWLLRGGSWGVTLSLGLRRTPPRPRLRHDLGWRHVDPPVGIDWLYRGAGRIFPEAGHGFATSSGLRITGSRPNTEPPIECLLMAYSQLMESSDPAIRAQAAAEWVTWEDAVISLEQHGTPGLQQQPARRGKAGVCPAHLRALLRPRRLPRRRRAYPRRRQAEWHPRHPRPGAHRSRRPSDHRLGTGTGMA